MNGQVIIGTKLDTKELERELKSAERQLQQYEKEAEKLTQTKIKIEADVAEYERQKQLIEESTNARLKQAQTEEQVNFVLGEENMELTELNTKYSESFQNLENINKKIQENEKNQGLTNNKVKEFRNELNRTQGFSGIKNSIESVGNSIESTIKKMSRWALSIFGIRSAYMFVRQEMGVLSGYNEQIGTDIEYMRFAIATTLQPVIETIIKLAYKLLTYIAYIAKAWFGVNIFAKASSKAFGDANNKVKATNKSAKELSKTIAGFDEMNILQKDGGVGTGGGGGGITPPSVDLSQWDKIKVPGWIEWIAKNKDLILNFFKQLAIAIATFKIAEFLVHIAKLFGLLEGMSSLAIFGLTAGIAITLIGIYQTIIGIINFVKDPSWENFVKILNGLETILIGVGVAMVALNASNPVGWIMIAIGAVGKLVTELTKQKKSTDNLREAEKKLKDARKNLLTATDEYVQAIDDANTANKNLKDAQDKTGISASELINWMKKENIDYASLNENQKIVYKAYLDNENAQQKVTDSKKKMEEATRNESNASLDTQRIISKESGEYDKLKESIINAWKQGKISTKDARLQIAQIMDGMDEDAKKTFVDGIPKKIMGTFNTNKYKKNFTTFEYWWNKSLNSLKDSITLTITTKINTSAKNAIASATSKIKKSAKGSIIYPNKIPRLAVGGIINQPGRGVPIASAIGGERGAEAVVPLTDSQQMALLGEAIGKYITIDLTNITQLDGRQIARKVEQINQNNKFVLNR